MVSTESRVMPLKAELARGGVKMTPLRTMKTFSPEPSLTSPFTSSAMPSW